MEGVLVSDHDSKPMIGAAWCLLLALCLAPGLAAAQNGNANPNGQLHGQGSERSALGAGNGEGLVHGQGRGLEAMRPLYYLARPDPRMCPSPWCGGWWVRAVNRDGTLCSDGTVAEVCYVAQVDGVPAGPYGLLFGHIGEVEFGGYPVGAFQATAAWRSIGGHTGSGLGVLLRDIHLTCVSEPCFTFEQTELNGDAQSQVSGVDLSDLNATDADIDDAFAALDDDGLLALGENVVVPDQGPAGDGIDFVATDAYLPLR